MNPKNLQVLKLQLIGLRNDIISMYGNVSTLDKKLDLLFDRQQLIEEIIKAETEKTGEEWSVLEN